MILTKKVLVEPDAATTSTLWYISRCANRLWNTFVEQRRNAYIEGRKVTTYDQKKRLPTLKKEDSRFCDPSSQVLQEVALTLGEAYASFVEKRKNGDVLASPPGFRKTPVDSSPSATHSEA